MKKQRHQSHLIRRLISIFENNRMIFQIPSHSMFESNENCKYFCAMLNFYFVFGIVLLRYILSTYNCFVCLNNFLSWIMEPMLQIMLQCVRISRCDFLENCILFEFVQHSISVIEKADC